MAYKNTKYITKEMILELFEKEKRPSWVALELNIAFETLKRLMEKYDIRVGNKRGYKKVDMTGKKCGFLTVLEENGKDREGRICWKCQCKCGNIMKKVTGKYLRNGHVKSCGCFDRGYGDVIPGYFYIGVKSRALYHGIDWEIDYPFLCQLYKDQKGLCALTGRLIGFSKSKKEYLKYRTTTASIDRKNSDRGYYRDNVQWVHKKVNKLKSDLHQEEFLIFCQEVVDWSKNGK